MKISRFIALALIALLVVGAMGVISYKVFAQGGTLHDLKSAFQAPDCGQDEAGDTEEQSANENGDVEGQCVDQNAPEEQETGGTEDTEAALRRRRGR